MARSAYAVRGTRVTSPRAKVRARVLAQLRAAAGVLRFEITAWAGGASLWDPIGNSQPPARYRALDEYPENNVKAMRDTSDMLAKLGRVLQEMAVDLRFEAAEVEREQRESAPLPCGCPANIVRDEGHQEGCSAPRLDDTDGQLWPSH